MNTLRRLWTNHDNWWRQRSELAWLSGVSLWMLVPLYALGAGALLLLQDFRVLESADALGLQGLLHWLVQMTWFAGVTQRVFRSELPGTTPVTVVAIQLLGFALLHSVQLGALGAIEFPVGPEWVRSLSAEALAHYQLPILQQACVILKAPLGLLVAINLARRGFFAGDALPRLVRSILFVAIASALFSSIATELLLWITRSFYPLFTPGMTHSSEEAIQVAWTAPCLQAIAAALLVRQQGSRRLLSREAAFAALMVPLAALVPSMMTSSRFGFPSDYGPVIGALTFLLSVALSLVALAVGPVHEKSPGVAPTDELRLTEARPGAVGTVGFRSVKTALRAPGVTVFAVICLGLGAACFAGSFYSKVAAVWGTVPVASNMLQAAGLLVAVGMAVQLRSSVMGLRAGLALASRRFALTTLLLTLATAGFVGARLVDANPMRIEEAVALCDSHYRAAVVVADWPPSAQGLLERMQQHGICEGVEPVIHDRISVDRSPVAPPLDTDFYLVDEGNARRRMNPGQPVLARSDTRRGFWDQTLTDDKVDHLLRGSIALAERLAALLLLIAVAFSKARSGKTAWKHWATTFKAKSAALAFWLFLLVIVPYVSTGFGPQHLLLWAFVLVPFVREKDLRAFVAAGFCAFASIALWSMSLSVSPYHSVIPRRDFFAEHVIVWAVALLLVFVGSRIARRHVPATPDTPAIA